MAAPFTPPQHPGTGPTSPLEETPFGGEATTRQEAAVEAIEQYILRERLKPGDPLPSEAVLCDVLGVSRSSVREAERQLQGLDIVRVHRGRGAFVGDMSLQPFIRTLMLRSSIHNDQMATLREVVATRKFLDTGLGRDLVIEFSGKQHPAMHALVDRMLQKAQANETFFDEDIAFHRAMISELHNTLMEELARAMWFIHMTAVPNLPAPGSDSMLQTAASHRDMLIAAEAGDLLGYLAAVDNHYRPLEATINTSEAE